MNHCGKEMEKLFNTVRGRWEKEVYKCSECGIRQSKRIRQIGNVKRRYQ